MNSSPMISQLLKLDTFSSVITLLILFISFTVQKFAFNYLKGEKDQWKFYLSCNIITVASIILVSADSFRLFAFTLLVANLALASLIGLKSKWQEGKSSAIYCLVNFIVAFIFLFIAIEIIKIDSISTINIVGVSTSSAILIIAAALIQSAIFPFHKWLMSSLNAPSPVSALMHAGLVNGGGIILIKFHNAIFANALIAQIVFFIAAISTFIALWWMLIRPDIKSTLAASTISQMGMMIMQIAAGLIPAAITHLILHGIYKAYCFLNAGSALTKNKLEKNKQAQLLNLSIAALISLGFCSLILNISWSNPDSRMLTYLLIFITSSQITLSILKEISITRLITSIFASAIVVSFYNFLLIFTEKLLETGEYRLNPIDLNPVLVSSLVVFFSFWLTTNLINCKKLFNNQVLSNLYIKLLNSSNPQNFTISQRKA
ncbi:MAG: hypothetical protein LW817_00700 [Candidatus Caenarcaniphilales bacterium]|jgi:NAD(P)H-quinone oxidoreductase subunit 5|nr:hypothetical protein [Candidatus Caenarcaniphilales bacterium]